MQYVYLLRAGEKHYKVGIAVNVRSRAKILQAQNPELVEVVTSKLADIDAYEIEQSIHESLKAMKAKGANEWFELTPEQAIELAIKIHSYPDIDISERATLSELVRQQRSMQKRFDRKLDFVIDSYQRDRIRPFRRDNITDLSSPPGTVPYIEPADRVEAVMPPEDTEQVMFDRAKAVVLEENKASTSLLQRRLRIGYGRAARIIEQLEKEGVVGPADGSRPRRINVPETIETAI